MHDSNRSGTRAERPFAYLRPGSPAALNESLREVLEPLVRLEDRVLRVGLDHGRRLGGTDHEIRSMVCFPQDGGRYLLIVGTRTGEIRARAFGIEDRGEAEGGFVKLAPLPSGREPGPCDVTDPRSIEALAVVHWDRADRGLVVGTRGQGVWLLSLPAIEGRLEETTAPQGWSGTELRALLAPRDLAESGVQALRALLFDPRSSRPTLFAAVGDTLWSWRFEAGRRRIPRPSRAVFSDKHLLALALDESPATPRDDALYLSLNDGTLRVSRRDEAGDFQVVHDVTSTETAWSSRDSVAERLVPISRIRQVHGTACPALFARDRGVIGSTLRHAFVITDCPASVAGHKPPKSLKPASAFRSRVVSSSSTIVQIEVLAVDDDVRLVVSSHEALVPSTEEQRATIQNGHVRFLRRPGLRERSGRAEAGCQKGALALLGAFDKLAFPDDARLFASLPPGVPSSAGDRETPLLIATGTREVRLYRYANHETLRTQARSTAERLAADDRVTLEGLQHLALRSAGDTPLKFALIDLLPALFERALPADDGAVNPDLARLAYDILTYSGDLPSVVFKAISTLRSIQHATPRVSGSVEKLIASIRRYVLGGSAFSLTRERRLELLATAARLPFDDDIVHRSILASTRTDPVFLPKTEPLSSPGEVRAFSPYLRRDPRGAPWHRASPAQTFFLISTRTGSLRFCDAAGHSLEVTGAEKSFGYVRNFYFGKDGVVFAFSGGQLCFVPHEDFDVARERFDEGVAPVRFFRLSLRRMPGVTGAEAPPSAVYAFCPPPGDDGPARQAEPTCLCGDSEGRIYRIWLGSPGAAGFTGQPAGDLEAFYELLVDVRSFEAQAPPALRVFDLRSSVFLAGGARHELIFACTSSGSLHMIDYARPRHVDPVSVTVGDKPLIALVHPHDRHRLVIAANTAGTVAAFQLVEAHGDGDASAKKRIRPKGKQPAPVDFALRWSYRAGGMVRAIHAYEVARGDFLVGVASFDERVHLLDTDGRLLETLYLPGVRIGDFVPAPPPPDLPGDSPSRVEALLYLCRLDARLIALRVFDRFAVIGDIQAALLRRAKPEPREDVLARLHAFALHESHLRDRFVRSSRRYPGPEVADCLDEIERLIRVGDNGERATGEMTALLQRLFDNRAPGGGLRTLLADDQSAKRYALFGRSLAVLRALEDRWNAPGHELNVRVQRYWIRSFLRNLTSPLLPRWLKAAKYLATYAPTELQGRLIAPAELLCHFFQHNNEHLQLKALHYLERLFFGWKGDPRSGILLDRPARGRALQAVLKLTCEALLERLRARPDQISSREPHPVVTQIARLFSLAFVVQEGVLDPSFLAYHLRIYGISEGFYPVLVARLRALADDPRPFISTLASADTTKEPSADFEDQVRARAKGAITNILASQRLRALAGDRLSDVGEIIESVDLIVKSANIEAPNESWFGQFREDERNYLSVVAQLLMATELGEVVEADVGIGGSAGNRQYYRSKRMYIRLLSIMQSAADYISLTDSGRRFDYGAYVRMRGVWKRLRVALRRVSIDDELESALLERVMINISDILDRERDIDILSEFIEKSMMLDAYIAFNKFETRSQLEDGLRRERRAVEKELRSLFERIIAFSEVDRAYMVLRPEHASEAIGFELPAKPDVEAPVRRLDADVIRGLVERGAFEAGTQGPEVFRAWLRPRFHWEVVPLLGVSRERSALGYYAFGWRIEKEGLPETLGFQRFVEHASAWRVPLGVLRLRRAAVASQRDQSRLYSMAAHTLQEPIYHMRSGLWALAAGRFESDAKERLDKYDDLLRTARHMFGVVDSVMHLGGRRLEVSITRCNVLDLVRDVMSGLARRTRAKGISIHLEQRTEVGLDGAYRTDEDKLYGILINLLDNAIKYSPPSSIVTVGGEIHAYSKRRWLVLRISDQGPGIPQEDRERIFEPFERGSTQASVPGMGLGCYVAWIYARALDGRVEVHEAPGGGASFEVKIPELEEEVGP